MIDPITKEIIDTCIREKRGMLDSFMVSVQEVPGGRRQLSRAAEARQAIADFLHVTFEPMDIERALVKGGGPLNS